MSTDDQLAVDLADQAGKLLLRLRQELADADPATRKAEGDRQAHEVLVAALSRSRPGDAVLSEEGAEDLARLVADRVWIVDPLDGTREFGEADWTDWAVHVALWQGETTSATTAARSGCSAVGSAVGAAAGTRPAAALPLSRRAPAQRRAARRAS